MQNLVINIFIFFIFFVGLRVFVSNRKHLLITLIRLEFIVLVIYLYIYIYLYIIEFEAYFRIVFLTISVCEGALGLSILVSLIRGYGNDYFQSYNIL